VAEYGLSRADAAALTADRATADYFDATVADGQEQGIAPRTVGNWVTGELFRLLREEDSDLGQARIKPSALVALIVLVEQGIITAGTGKIVLKEMFSTGRPAESIIQEKGLAQISDEQQLARLVDDVIAANPEQVARYRAGKETLLGWFMGQVMRETRGKASPQVVRGLLQSKLEG
jgi:aspartyl-tRNA(Asn)/glutamyl-tRNA(Gln) amidotransferase subunit B